MSIRPLDEQKCPLDIHMSIRPLDEQKCPLDIQMSIRPLGKQKCLVDIQMCIRPMDEQKCPVDIQMSIGHLAEVLDMYEFGWRIFLLMIKTTIILDKIKSMIACTDRKMSFIDYIRCIYTINFNISIH